MSGPRGNRRLPEPSLAAVIWPRAAPITSPGSFAKRWCVGWAVFVLLGLLNLVDGLLRLKNPLDSVLVVHGSKIKGVVVGNQRQ